MKLNIYTDRSFIRANSKYVPLLFPFWGECDSMAGNIDYGRYEEFTNVGGTYFSTVPIEHAHGVVLPSEWPEGGKYPEASKIANEAHKYGKPIIIFFNSDSTEEIPIRNSLVFRTSLYSSKRKANEFALPGWSLDFLKAYLDGNISIRKKKSIQTISYTGYVDYNSSINFAKCMIRRVVYGRESNPGRYLRGEAIRLLKKRREIRTNIFIREAGWSAISGCSSETLRKEYVRNMVDSDYALVVRGKGNFSYRLYEILSCGRIPIFVNTDCVLPFDHLVNWEKYMIWIESDDIDSIADRIVDYHSSISDKEFEEMQHNCRNLYEEWIRPTGFYSNIWRCLPQF